MKDENEIKEKQEFLRIHILEKGYDADEFMEFLETLKGEKGLKIENWSKNDLIQAVEQFTKMNPRQDIIKINNNNNNNFIVVEKNNEDEIKEMNNEINDINNNNDKNNDNKNIFVNHLLDQEFLQCRLSERNGISEEKNLVIKISQPKVI